MNCMGIESFNQMINLYANENEGVENLLVRILHAVATKLSSTAKESIGTNKLSTLKEKCNTKFLNINNETNEEIKFIVTNVL